MSQTAKTVPSRWHNQAGSWSWIVFRVLVVASQTARIGLPPYREMRKDFMNTRFLAYARKQGLDPYDLVPEQLQSTAKLTSKSATWQMVKAGTVFPNRPVQYYEAVNFRYRLWVDQLRLREKKLRRSIPINWFCQESTGRRLTIFGLTCASGLSLFAAVP